MASFSDWDDAAEGLLDGDATSLDDMAQASEDTDPDEPLEILPSEFAESVFYFLNDRDKHRPAFYEPMDFTSRPYLREIYDTDAKRLLLVFARQSEKSTSVGNKILTTVALRNGYTFIYVSPSQMQTKTFSNDRIRVPIETSPHLKSLKANMVSENILEKRFANNSQIILRYAFLNAERTRGITGHGLAMDEFQDILADNIPVIEMTTSHANEEMKVNIYSGTPKSLDNNIEHYRANKSTQHEWCIPCDCRGGEGGRFWNILNEKNMGLKFAICERCGKQLNVTHPDAAWHAQVAFDPIRVPWTSYRICQLMVAWRSWQEIMVDYHTYSRAKFYNEVLGISYDSGMRPLTQAQLMSNCVENASMLDVEELRQTYAGQDVFMGLDYGSGEKAYTVLSLGAYVGAKFRIFYMERFIGEFAEFEPQIKRICQFIDRFGVKVVGADHGYGKAHNDMLIRRYGRKLFQYQYVAKQNRKVQMRQPQLQRFTVHRTEIMGDMFNGIRRGIFEFPRWPEFSDPFAKDILSIFSEENERLNMIQYKHPEDTPDDSFHSITYCFLASQAIHPRPDVMKPRKADELAYGEPNLYQG